MNQIQVIGTHNSYHAGLAPSEAKLMMAKNPKVYQALEYRHHPLDQQFSSGIRQIELDIFADSQVAAMLIPQARRQSQQQAWRKTRSLTLKES
jgi:hypothetical protein